MAKGSAAHLQKVFGTNKALHVADTLDSDVHLALTMCDGSDSITTFLTEADAKKLVGKLKLMFEI
jgi:hypothetical protein